MPKISVIVPIYNVEKYLKEALDSILAQTLSDLEIILINDGSKDKCCEIINEYAKHDDRIIPIHKENEGYGKTCNLGLKHATGEYIAIVEPDDFIDPKMYEDLYKIAKDNDSDIVKSSFFDNLQSKEQKWIKQVNWPDFIPEDKSFTIYEYPHFLTYHPSIWSCIYKKEFLDKNNINFVEAPGAGWSDNPFQVQTMCLAERINYTKNAYYYWRRLNYFESDDLKDYTIPFKRCDEIHKWLENNNIIDATILSALAKREMAYINIVLGMKKISNTKDCYDRIEKMLDRTGVYKKDYKNLPLKRFKILMQRYRKEIISIKLSKKEKSIMLFGKNILKAQNKTETLNNQEIINICFASDDNYAQHLAVAISSILKNSSKNDIYNIHILNGDISGDNKEKILNLKKIRQFNCYFYNMEKFDFSLLPLNREYISAATYYRLFITDILPKDIDKLIYLDCDIIAKVDLKILHSFDISGYLAGVIEDEGSITQSLRLKLPVENNYFNAGVMVFNLKQLRSFDLKEKCFNYYKANQNIITLQDQDILNGVFNGKCKFLPLCWNANGRLYRYNELKHNYTKKDEAIAKKHPAIIHYTDTGKPWDKHCYHPLQIEYFKYKWFTKYKWKNLNVFLHKFIQSLFSLKNKTEGQNKYKIVTILGIRIKKHIKE